jgi:glutamyl-tRNA reductase
MIVLLGLNHRTADLSLREKCHFPREDIPGCLRDLTSFREVQEALILSTCNRVELVADVGNLQEGIPRLKDFLHSRKKLEANHTEKSLYVHDDVYAIHHLFRVASSLDSMVVGEPQILGQMKEAFRIAMEVGSTGKKLNRCFHRAFYVAKRVRTETEIARHPVSVGSVMVELASKIFDKISDQVVLFVGAGEMIQETAQGLLGLGVTEILVTNRTHEKAHQLAEQFHGTTFFLDKLTQHLPRADIIITCTSSVDPLITVPMVNQAMRRRNNKPTFYIDLAVPRNIEKEIQKRENVYLYNIDDLSGIAKVNLAKRENEIHQAEAIINQECKDFSEKVHSNGFLPLISSLNKKAEKISKEELEKTLKRFPDLTEEQLQAMESMTKSITKKILHDPISHIKNVGPNEEDKDSIYRLIRRIFRL